jgi:hypothetical protein
MIKRQPSSFTGDSRIGITPITIRSCLSLESNLVDSSIVCVSPESVLLAPFLSSSSPAPKNTIRVSFDSSRVEQKRHSFPFRRVYTLRENKALQRILISSCDAKCCPKMNVKSITPSIIDTAHNKGESRIYAMYPNTLLIGTC